MIGPAKKLFLKQRGCHTKEFNLSKYSDNKTEPWPTLNRLYFGNFLAYIDLALAEELLQSSLRENEAAAALICYLSAAVRQGHLCIEVGNDSLTPPALDLLEKNNVEEKQEEGVDNLDRHESIHDFQNLIHRGLEQLPEGIVSKRLLSEAFHETVHTPLCRVGNRLYFQRHWYYESLFFHHYLRFADAEPTIKFDANAIDQHTSDLNRQEKLLKEQAEAILSGCRQSLTLICGGPGTGKTYTAGLLIAILCHSLPPEKIGHFEIALAAPTGKAAANLQKSLLRAAKGFGNIVLPQSKTLHALLGIRSDSRSSEPLLPLSADLVIVDEASMIDARLMSHLFAAIKPGARLILLGDPFQLPAVESGSLFADLIASAAYLKNASVEELKVCLRTELKGIVDFASAVKTGDIDSCQKTLDGASKESGIKHTGLESEGLQGLIRYVLPFFQVDRRILDSHHQLLVHYDRFRMLSPFRRGPFGVESINAALLKEQRRLRSMEGVFVAPIILLRNEPRLDLFNGETGVLVRAGSPNAIEDSDFMLGDYALFPARDESGSVRSIPALLLPAFEYAYCLSVHKSQGSEFEKVLLLLPQGADVFGREVLYTAITRARKCLELWDQPDVLEKTLDRKSCRLSSFRERLQLI